MITNALINGASGMLQWLATLFPQVALPTFPAGVISQYAQFANAFVPLAEAVSFAVWLAGAASIFLTGWLLWRVWFAIKW
jgi:hypothetical protein